jgi:hypothetical protein
MVNWEARKKRWNTWKAMQRDFSLPACDRCGHRFQPENVGQTVCSTRCFRIMVLKGMKEHDRKMQAFAKNEGRA